MSRPLGIRHCAATVVMAMSLLFGGCASDDPADTAGPSTSATTTTGPADGGPTTCEAPTYNVGYPADWSTNSADDGAPCRWFHPEAFELPQNSEAVGIAIHLRYEAVDFARLTNPANRSEDVIAVDQKQVDGRDAVRMRTRSRGEGLLDAGVEIVSWYANTGSQTFAATTTGAAEGSLDDNAAVLDQMMRSLRFTSDPCSAVEQRGLSTAASDLPRAVAEMRERIFDAARACDYERLTDLAAQGERRFTFSFGVGTDPGAHWRAEEEQGRDPLRKLAAILDVSHATRQNEGVTQFLWPSAFGYESWSEVPEDAKRELTRVYTPDEIQNFEKAGVYLGYRVGIAADGEWLFFVAGD